MEQAGLCLAAILLFECYRALIVWLDDRKKEKTMRVLAIATIYDGAKSHSLYLISEAPKTYYLLIYGETVAVPEYIVNDYLACEFFVRVERRLILEVHKDEARHNADWRQSGSRLPGIVPEGGFSEEVGR